MAYGRRRRNPPANLLSQRNLDRFANALRSKLDAPSSGLRRGYVRLLVESVKVGEQEIEIRGSTTALLSAASKPKEIELGVVPTSIPEWRC